MVARQIPGRSRPLTGKSRCFAGVEKPSILYSRQELAERLRLAWKHREANKANINIFLAHGVLEERCDSEMSGQTTINDPSSPLLRNNPPESGSQDEQHEGSRIRARFDGDRTYKGTRNNITGEKSFTALASNDALDKNEDELDFEHPCTETQQIAASEAENSTHARDERKERTNAEETRTDVSDSRQSRAFPSKLHSKS